LTLEGRIDDRTLREALGALKSGAEPGWRIVADRSSIEIAGVRSGLHLLGILGEAALGLLLSTAVPRLFGSTRTALQVRTVVLEYTPTHQRTRLRFRRLESIRDQRSWHCLKDRA
jgi:hypothetical protein